MLAIRLQRSGGHGIHNVGAWGNLICALCIHALLVGQLPLVIVQLYHKKDKELQPQHWCVETTVPLWNV